MDHLAVTISEVNIFQFHICSVAMFGLRWLRQFLHIEKGLDTGLHLRYHRRALPEVEEGLQRAHDRHGEKDAQYEFTQANRTA